ncbi:hypothetical protein [Amantichitinum ursilacus]|uniref:Uncharacterized protein n=1 Tax=Amantichitinum ursilacus TaxID=857265 RepID=A0A0N0XFT8_9NEIS|nr:hypothetical protein [Amantichitinum ursilacus]KPC49363.1 hypothetical protein WG78_20750 [Amantichitinum ursilacus]
MHHRSAFWLCCLPFIATAALAVPAAAASSSTTQIQWVAPLCVEGAISNSAWVDETLVTGVAQAHVPLYKTWPLQCQGEQCTTSMYLLPQDLVRVRSQCGDWVYVDYISPQLRLTSGWMSAAAIKQGKPGGGDSNGLINAIQIRQAKTPVATPTGHHAESSSNICQTTANLQTLGILERYRVPGKHEYNFNDLRGLTRATDPLLQDVGGWAWRVDLDGRGRRDYVLISNLYSQTESGFVLSGTYDLNAPDASAAQLEFIKLGKSYYFAAYDPDLSGLYRVKSSGAVTQVCAFERDKKPVSQLTIGADKEICQKAATDQIKDITLSQSDLPPLQDPRAGHQTQAWTVDGTADIDLRNNGHTEQIALLRIAGNEGRYGQAVAVLAGNPARIAATPFNTWLLEVISGAMTYNSPIGLLSDGDVNYLDLHHYSGNRSIILLRDQRAELVCQFAGRYAPHPVPTDDASTIEQGVKAQ